MFKSLYYCVAPVGTHVFKDLEPLKNPVFLGKVLEKFVWQSTRVGPTK